jgi:hypothetical protein
MAGLLYGHSLQAACHWNARSFWGGFFSVNDKYVNFLSLLRIALIGVGNIPACISLMITLRCFSLLSAVYRIPMNDKRGWQIWINIDFVFIVGECIPLRM